MKNLPGWTKLLAFSTLFQMPPVFAESYGRLSPNRLTAVQETAARNLYTAYGTLSNDFPAQASLKTKQSYCEYISGQLECAFNFTSKTGTFGIRAAYVESGNTLILNAFTVDSLGVDLVGEMPTINRPISGVFLLPTEATARIADRVHKAMLKVPVKDLGDPLLPQSRCIVNNSDEGWCSLAYAGMRESYLIDVEFLIDSESDLIRVETLTIERD